jgi:hypothetical protein|nr:MAG TPA: hypothetical protein [Caudoviricetes sp.]
MKELTKTSTSAEIKQYFNAILKLSKASEEFPVNLDEVWPLVYSAKNKAVSALKENFMEGVDYQSLNQKVERKIGATMKDEYFLSVPCLEFFIARKVRDVFEVYRQVFHKTAKKIENKDPMAMNANTLYNLRMKAVAWTAKMLNLSEESKLRMIQAVTEPLGLPSPNYVKSQGVMHSATYLLKERSNLISILQFNQKMIAAGYLEEKERPSKSKGTSRFKCLTEKGLIYGENEVCPKNALETQPHYYDDKFDELLEKLLVIQ